ncbi:hypothetical protein GQ457_12G011580 [Hibiscus cannabinus]
MLIDWKAFQLARHGTLISHIFLVDDLILYARVDMANVANLEAILETFGLFSGHTVNKKKTKVFFSPNTSSDLSIVICDRLGFQHVSYLGMYLGVFVRHASATIYLPTSCNHVNYWLIFTTKLRHSIADSYEVLTRLHNESLWLTGTLCVNPPFAGAWGFAIQEYKTAWPSFYDNISWTLGDENYIQFWSYNWIPELCPPYLWVILGISIDIGLKISKFKDIRKNQEHF